MNLELERPLCVFDIESTGTDPANDRIVTLAIVKLFPNGVRKNYQFMINPGIAIPKEASDVHGITNDMVSDLPRFVHFADSIHSILVNCDIGGYNSNYFDVPMLVEEFLRVNFNPPFNESTKFIDVQTIFKKKESRTLSAAVKFFLNRDMENAHNAVADTDATLDVLLAQIDRYTDIGNTVEALSKFSQYDNNKNYDYAGKLVYNEDGVICYNIGKVKGIPVHEDLGFAYWMLDRDFPLDTKRKLNYLIEKITKDDFSFFNEEKSA